MKSRKIKDFLDVLTKLLEHIFHYFIMLLLTLILIIIPLQVFCRFGLHHSLSWPDEVSPYLLAWITFLGSVLAMRKGEHINFDVLINKMGNKLRFYIVVLRELIVLLFLFILFYFGIPIVRMKWADKAYTIPVSKGLIYTCIVLGALLMLILTILRIVRTIYKYRKKNIK